MTQALAAKAHVAQALAELAVQGGEEELTGVQHLLGKALTREGGQVVHEDPQLPAGAVTECKQGRNAPAGAPGVGQAALHGVFQVVPGLQGLLGLHLAAAVLGGAGHLAELGKAGQPFLSGRDAPARVFHQCHAGSREAFIPVLGYPIRTGLQGAGQTAHAPFGGIVRGAHHNDICGGTCAYPLHDLGQRLAGPASRVFLGQGLLRLFVQSGQHGSKGVGRLPAERGAGGLFDALTQRFRTKLGIC